MSLRRIFKGSSMAALSRKVSNGKITISDGCVSVNVPLKEWNRMGLDTTI